MIAVLRCAGHGAAEKVKVSIEGSRQDKAQLLADIVDTEKQVHFAIEKK